VIDMICTTCGYQGKAKKTLRGSWATELFLYLFFIVPGLIYTIWRQSGPGRGCPKCKNETMIPGDSPMGQKLIAQLATK
jgi:hypothetical protein